MYCFPKKEVCDTVKVQNIDRRHYNISKHKLKQNAGIQWREAAKAGRHAEAVSKQRSFHPSLRAPLSSTKV